MRKQDEQMPTADEGPVERVVRPGSEARWYCLSREGWQRCAQTRKTPKRWPPRAGWPGRKTGHTGLRRWLMLTRLNRSAPH